MACSKFGGGSGERQPVPSISPVDSISVKSGGKAVETFEFTYDSEGRLATLLRRDETSGKDILNLSYKYVNGSEMTVSGIMAGRMNTRTITVNHSSSDVSYKADGGTGWRYTTALGRDGVAVSTSFSSKFKSSAGAYSSDTDYTESYVLADKDIAQIETVTNVEGRASRPIFGSGNGLKPAKVSTGSTLVTKYTYSDKPDRQNFCALVFNCNLPVWYAEGLPGCEHLVTDVNMFNGGVDLYMHQHFDYTLNDRGDIQKVVRTYGSEGVDYLKLEYEFYYKQ